MRNHGIDPARRWARMREQVLAMKEIWMHTEPLFHGAEVGFEPIWQWPKPWQRPHPPVLVGGEGPTVLDRVLDYGDGWLPNDHPEVHGRIEELRQRAETAGIPTSPLTMMPVLWPSTSPPA